MSIEDEIFSSYENNDYSPIDAEFNTTDVQGNNIKDKDINDSTKAVVSVWMSRIWKNFANSRPHKTWIKTKLSK